MQVLNCIMRDILNSKAWREIIKHHFEFQALV